MVKDLKNFFAFAVESVVSHEVIPGWVYLGVVGWGQVRSLCLIGCRLLLYVWGYVKCLVVDGVYFVDDDY